MDVQRSAKWIKLSQYNIEIQRNIRKTTNIALMVGRNVEKKKLIPVEHINIQRNV